MAEPIKVDIQVNDVQFEQKLWQAKIFARDTKKEIDKNVLFTLQLDVVKFQDQVKQAKNELKKAQEIWDQWKITLAQIDLNTLKSQLTEANRQLNNYVNTGDKDLSRLQVKFNQIETAIRESTAALQPSVTILADMSQKINQLWSGNFKNLRQDVGGLNAEINWLQTAYAKGKLSQEQFAAGVQWVQSKVSSLSKEFEKQTTWFNGFVLWIKNSMTSLAWLVWQIGIVAWFKELSSGVLTLAGNLEQTSIAFTTMLWNAESAQRLLKQLADFAKRTPFELTGIREQAKLLLAYGIAADDVISTLSILGNIAAWVGTDKLPRLVTALWQVKAKTVLAGEELRQFTETGVPLISELAKVTGHSVAEITWSTKELWISYAQVLQALQNLTSEWGKFNWLLDAQSKTFQGSLSNLKDSLNSLWEAIGTIFIPALTKVVQWITAITTPLAQFAKENQALVAILWTVVTVLWLVIAWLTALWFILPALTAVAWAFWLTLAWLLWPVWLIIAAVAALTWWYFALKAAMTEIWNSNEKTWKSLWELKKALEENRKKQAELHDEYQRGKVTMVEYNKKLKEMQNEEAELKKKTETAHLSLEDIRVVIKKLNDTPVKTKESRAALEAERQAAIADAQALLNVAKARALSLKQQNEQLQTAEKKKQEATSRGENALLWAWWTAGTEWLTREVINQNQIKIDAAQKDIDQLSTQLEDLDKLWEKFKTTTDTIPNWDKGASQASKILKAKEKALDEQARKEINAVKKSEATEVDKARSILAITEKLERDKNVIRWEDLDNEKAAAEEILKAQQDNLEKKAKAEIDSVNNSKLTELEKAQAIVAINNKLTDDINNLKNDAFKNDIDNANDVIKKYDEIRTAWQTAFDDLWKAVDDSAARVDKLNDKLTDTKEKLKTVVEDIAKRVIELEKDIKDLNEQLASETDPKKREELFTSLSAAQKELALANANVNQEILQKVREEEAKSETQKLLDKQASYAQQIKDLESQIEKEINLQKFLQDEKLRLEQDFTSKLWIELQKQTDLIKKAVDARIASYQALQLAKERASESNLLASGNTTTNNTNINANVSNNVDWESLLNSITKIVNTH